jgi:uncharacterized lipoprotein YmbA
MRWLLLKLFLLSLCACASAPNIHRYTLHSAPALTDVMPLLLQGGLGVGPIELPESWRQGEVVVWDGKNQIVSDGRHLWAGDPKRAISRVLADNLGQRLQLDDVWAHPWDVRAKPQHQILLVIESFGGQLGGTVVLQAKWRLMTEQGTKSVVTERQVFSATATDKTYGAYVAAINQLVNQLSSGLEQSVRSHLKN